MLAYPTDCLLSITEVCWYTLPVLIYYQALLSRLVIVPLTSGLLKSLALLKSATKKQKLLLLIRVHWEIWGLLKMLEKCLKMLPSACGQGQHFLDLGHSFSLYGPPSRQITYIYTVYFLPKNHSKGIISVFHFLYWSFGLSICEHLVCPDKRYKHIKSLQFHTAVTSFSAVNLTQGITYKSYWYVEHLKT